MNKAKKDLNFKGYQILAGLKNLLVISSGAIIGNMIVIREYDYSLLIYSFIGIFGYALFDLLEEASRKQNGA